MRRPEPDFAGLRARMVAEQLERRGISDPRVLKAMGTVPRDAFTDADDRKRAYEDLPIQIGWGQTISQPYMVALICEAAALRPGNRVLDVGTGSDLPAELLTSQACAVVVPDPAMAPEARTAMCDQFRAVGFAEVAQVPLGDLNSVWIGRA